MSDLNREVNESKEQMTWNDTNECPYETLAINKSEIINHLLIRM